MRTLLAGTCLLALLLLTACEGDYRPEAVGDTGTVVVVMDTAAWNGVPGEAARDVFQDPILTLPVSEPAFSMISTDLTDINHFENYVKKRKYLVIAGTLDDSSNVSRFLQARLEEPVQESIRNGESGIFQLNDLWYRNQRVVYVAAPDDETLAETLRANASDLRYTFNELNREEMEADMFSRMRQVDLEEILLDHHDFAVNVQHDYVLVTDTTNFVWLMRQLDESNWRSLFVYYEENADPTDLTPNWIYNTRNRLTREHIQGNLGDYVRIDARRPLETENISFLGHFGYESRGLWHMVGYDDKGELRGLGTGGPFVTYTFYDESQARIYMIDGMVFAPRFDKRELIRQLEVIAYTFRTAEEEEAAKNQEELAQSDS